MTAMKRVAVAVVAAGILCVGSDAFAAATGISCASAITLFSNSTYTSDTTTTTNWMTSFGPLVSPANDELYTFTAGPPPMFPIVPTAASYAFAMYLIPSCSDSGTEPSPIEATATVGTGLNLDGLPQGTAYYIAVTGIAAGGAGANGTVTFSTGPLPVELRDFTVD